ncbi:MAG TPA: urease accessory UreF family protein [Candidatus Acidoferrum sp.]|nr:urease accessory UreF family protein [Candidatus Acidoferrum sp.]
MNVGTKIAAPAPTELIGDAHPLLEQLGATDAVALATEVAAAIQLRHVRDVVSLRVFLDAYRTEILGPLELPTIMTAYGHASRGEVRELIQLDARLATEKGLRDFAIASCRVGQRQLSKLRALRDQRVVQRYLAAIEKGEARGWHTLVYGVALAVYSMPLRQGLQHYAQHTMRGFIESAARPLRLSETTILEVLSEQTAHVPQTIESTVAAQSLLRIS